MSRKRFKPPIIRTGKDPVLTEVCEDVLPDEDAMPICRALISVLVNSSRCVGLAANQVGITKRVIAIQVPGEYPRNFINPVIVDMSDKLVTLEEACLSYPGITANVERNEIITIQYENDARELKRETLSKMETRIALHEIDHLNGKCILSEIGKE